MDPYFDQVERNIKSLIGEQKFKEAYSLVKQLLAKYPGDKDAENLKKLVEKEVVASNQRLIDSKMPGLKKLFSEKKFPELVKECKALLKFDPDHKELVSLMNKAIKQYQEETSESLKNIEDSSRKMLEKLLSENPDRLVDELFSLDKAYAGNEVMKNVTSEYREKLIERLINEKEDLIYSDKFEAIDSFVKRLENISPTSQRVKDLKEMLRVLRHEAQTNDKREFLYKGGKHLQTLLRLKKFDKALQVAEELLEVNPNDKFARKVCNVARKKLYGVTRNDCVQLLLDHREEWQKELQSTPNSFVKI